MTGTGGLMMIGTAGLTMNIVKITLDLESRYLATGAR